MLKRPKTLAFVIVGALIAVGVATGGRWAYLHRPNYPWMYCAEYTSFILEGRTRGTHLRFISGHHRFKTFADGEIAKIYIKLPNREAFYLPDIAEQSIVEYMGLDNPNPPVEDAVSEYRDMYTFFLFRGGRLECVWLEKTDVLIANSPGGPFYSLPVSRHDAIAVFGRPLKSVAEVEY